MRYGIDMDGVIVDFHKGFAKVANQIWPGKIPPGEEYPHDWDYVTLGFAKGEFRQVRDRIAAIPNWWCSLPAIGLNVGAIFRHRLRYPEDEIFYVTARVDDSVGMPVMHQSQKWIDMCGIGGLGTAVIVTNGEIKTDLYHELGMDAVIDDDYRHLPDDIGYLLAREWNAAVREGRRVVKDLDEFFERVGRKDAK